MYDDDARCSGIGPHWYDEPPYESDPEDFLMGTNTGQPVPLSTIQNGRFVFVLICKCFVGYLVNATTTPWPAFHAQQNISINPSVYWNHNGHHRRLH